MGYLGLGAFARMYGSTIPRAAVPALGAAFFAFLLKFEHRERWISEEYFKLEDAYGGNAYAFISFVTTVQIVMRLRVAYGR